LENLWF